MEELIFISHKHDDKFVADIFKQNFLLWSVPIHNIFQSSDYRTTTLIGEPLKPQLKTALGRAVLVLLIYTDSDKDWEFCLWECGVATDPNDDTATRVALFQAGSQSSRVFQDDVIFTLKKEDIRTFVEQFHKKVGFVYVNQAFQPDVLTETLDKRADDLYTSLASLKIGGRQEERYRWDNFTLRLSHQNIEAYKRLSETDKVEYLLTNAKVVHSFGQAFLHFNYTADVKELTFKMLVDRWSQAMQDDKDIPRGWIQEICHEMGRAINDVPASPSWEVMKSLIYKDWWFYPIVNHVRMLFDGSFDFDIYMYRFPGTLPANPMHE